MFRWNHKAPLNYNISLYDGEKIVCTFKFSNRIDADHFIVRNNIKL